MSCCRFFVNYLDIKENYDILRWKWLRKQHPLPIKDNVIIKKYLVVNPTFIVFGIVVFNDPFLDALDLEEEVEVVDTIGTNIIATGTNVRLSFIEKEYKEINENYKSFIKSYFEYYNYRLNKVEVCNSLICYINSNNFKVISCNKDISEEDLEVICRIFNGEVFNGKKMISKNKNFKPNIFKTNEKEYIIDN